MAIGGLLAVAVLSVRDMLPAVLLPGYFGMSALTFVIYALDKASARRGGQRVPENTLHLLALLGGWPGALAAQQLLRHKSKKVPFRIVLWLVVATHCAGLAFLLSDAGGAWWQALWAR